MATDPVCNMKVDAEMAAAKTEHQGVTYYFCSEHCRKEFANHPEQYAVKPSGESSGHSRGCCS